METSQAIVGTVVLCAAEVIGNGMERCGSIEDLPFGARSSSMGKDQLAYIPINKP